MIDDIVVRQHAPSPTAWVCSDCHQSMEALTTQGACVFCGSLAVAVPLVVESCTRCHRPLLNGDITAPDFKQHANCENVRGTAGAASGGASTCSAWPAQ